MKTLYFVELNCIFSDWVEAENPEEAASILSNKLPIGIGIELADDSAIVIDEYTNEKYEI